MRRALLRWLMFSPRRLLTVVLIGVIAGTCAVQLPRLHQLLPPPAGPDSASSSSPPPLAAAPPPAATPLPPPAPRSTPPRRPTSPPPSTTRPPSSPTAPNGGSTTRPRPAAGSPQAQARKFAQLWVATDVGKRQWLAKLQPLCTEEYGSVVLPQVDPANIPATRIAGGVRVVQDTGRAATVEIELDNEVTIAVELVDVTGKGAWRVAAVSDASLGTI